MRKLLPIYICAFWILPNILSGQDFIVNTEFYTTDNSVTFAGKRPNSQSGAWWQAGLLGSGAIIFSIANNNWVITNNTFNDGNWHHVACVRQTIRGGKRQRIIFFNSLNYELWIVNFVVWSFIIHNS